LPVKSSLLIIWALGIGYWALGIGYWALGMRHKRLQGYEEKKLLQQLSPAPHLPISPPPYLSISPLL